MYETYEDPNNPWNSADPSDPGTPPPPPSAPSPDPNEITPDYVRALYSQYAPGYTPSEAEINSHLGHPGGRDALSSFFAQTYAPQTQGPPQAPPTGGGQSGGGGFDGGTFTPPTAPWDMAGWLAGQPKLSAPDFQPASPFVEPDYATIAANDPSYKFQRDQGTAALQASAAARGVVNGGGTLKDILAWGDNYAGQYINDVRNRAKDAYQLNYQTQTADPYKYAYQKALDTFTGGMSGWQTQGQVGQRANETNWQQAYTPYNDLWNRRIQVGLS